MSCWILQLTVDGTLARLRDQNPAGPQNCPAVQDSAGKGLDMIDLAGIFVFSGSFALLGILIGAPKACSSFRLWWQNAAEAGKGHLSDPTNIHRNAHAATMWSLQDWALSGSAEGGRVKWAVKFEATGELHRYTVEQMREKFGVEQARPGMEVCHNTRGKATIMTAFNDTSGHRTSQDSEPTTTTPVQHTSRRRVGKKWKRFAAPAARTLAAPAARTQEAEVEVETEGEFEAGTLEAILMKLDAQERKLESALQAQTALIEDRLPCSPASPPQPPK